MCYHMAMFGENDSPMPSSVVLCAPTSVSVTADEIIDALRASAAQEVEAPPEVMVPDSLISKDIIGKKLLEQQPLMMPTERISDEDYPVLGVIARRMTNGVWGGGWG